MWNEFGKSYCMLMCHYFIELLEGRLYFVNQITYRIHFQTNDIFTALTWIQTHDRPVSMSLHGVILQSLIWLSLSNSLSVPQQTWGTLRSMGYENLASKGRYSIHCPCDFIIQISHFQQGPKIFHNKSHTSTNIQPGRFSMVFLVN